MKSVLILYPIQPYADVLVSRKESPKIKRKYASIYQNLIRARYPGFQVTYLMFSKKEMLAEPDMNLLWDGISINKNDRVVACGVSFDEHCSKKKYPDLEKISLFPVFPEKLIIGGFHFWDCVEKSARFAHKRGIDVTVDDNLTEYFFPDIRNRRGLPQADRIPISFQESVAKKRKEFMELGRDSLRLVRLARRGKPWLARI